MYTLCTLAHSGNFDQGGVNYVYKHQRCFFNWGKHVIGRTILVQAKRVWRNKVGGPYMYFRLITQRFYRAIWGLPLAEAIGRQRANFFLVLNCQRQGSRALCGGLRGVTISAICLVSWFVSVLVRYRYPFKFFGRLCRTLSRPLPLQLPMQHTTLCGNHTYPLSGTPLPP